VDDAASSQIHPLAGFRCTRWWHNVVPAGGISVYRVAGLIVSGTLSHVFIAVQQKTAIELFLF
jgi:hypothetical protein